MTDVSRYRDREQIKKKKEENISLMKVKEERQDLNEVEEKHQDQKDHDLNTGEKSCGNTFKQKRSLMYHMIHTEETPYECSHCDKRFSDSGNLKTHKMIHTGEKPYHCAACGKHFSRSSALHSHTKNNHSKKIIFRSSTFRSDATSSPNVTQ
uniref:C2H2-type domain-containing protein n=1 Tax=Sinocyclocheilus grahami TaxID=75366 RepID=A0A672RV84_SINGR